MKKFTKVTLIIAGIMAIIGLAALIASLALGLTPARYAEMIRNGEFSLHWDDDLELDDDYISSSSGESSVDKSEHSQNGNAGESTENHSSNASSNTTGNGTDNATDNAADGRELVFATTFTDLELEIGAGKLTLAYGDVDQIQVKTNGDTGDLHTKTEGKTLKIEGGMWSDSERNITITLPTGMQLDELDIELGAGEATVTAIDARDINVEVGAGKLDMSVVGVETDYSYEVECGVGQIRIGNNQYSGLGQEQKINNPGTTRIIDASCAAGQIVIAFTNN